MSAPSPSKDPGFGFSNVRRLDFYAALRRIEAAHPDRPRLGRSRLPKDDPIRLGQSPHLEFPNATLEKTEQDPNGLTWLKIYCFGLFGPNGPLPLHLTEYAFERIHHVRDPAFAAFCDIFHHRLISLFYRAWADKEPTVTHDRPEKDRFAFYLGCLAGYGLSSQRDFDAMPDAAKRHFTAHLARHPRNAEGLEAIVSSFFGVRARVEEFVGEWLTIPEDDRCHLGQAMLGNTIVGERSFQRASRFDLHLGPLDYEAYEGFLPGGDRIAALAAIIQNWIGESLAWKAVLILATEEVPFLCLDGNQRLGWNTWLIGQPAACTKDDLKLDPLRYVQL